MKTNTLLALWNSYITAAITASAVTAYVASVTDIPTAPFILLLDCGSEDEELVKVTAVDTATKALTIVRAQGGTTGVAHAEDTLAHHCEIGAVNIDLDGLTVTLSAVGALNGMLLTVTDATVNTGSHSALKVAYNLSGENATGWQMGVEIAVTTTGYGMYTYGLVVSMTPVDLAGTQAEMAGISIWCNSAAGETIGNYYGITINLNNDGTITNSSFIKVRGFGAGVVDRVIQCDNPVTHLLRVEAAPYDNLAHGDTDMGRISIQVGALTRYLYVYSD